MTVASLFTIFITKVSWETLDNKLCKDEEKEWDYGLTILRNGQSFWKIFVVRA
jgi:hypothetical protein